MSFRIETGEILLVKKPYRWSSFDVVNYIRNFVKKDFGLGKIKIGHAGTLDPLATGLLIICTGIMTKKIEEFKDFDKEYAGTFFLGATTPSFDLEKEIDQTFPIQHITEEAIREATASLTGSYDQIPPVFSAIKIRGKRAYKYARKNEEIVIIPKRVHIPLFEITRIALPEVDFRVVCSKGTYIRALARDFGKLLNSGAYLAALCRTRIGPYYLRDAWEPEELKNVLTLQ